MPSTRRPVRRAATRSSLALASLVLLLGCSPAPAAPDSTASTATAEPATTEPARELSLSSEDFEDGGELDEQFTANAFAGQCRGENLNPELSWADAPEGTASFAITMIDRSANDFVHWVHAAIPASTTGVAQGAASELAGVSGQSATGQFGYFGPCPPTPNHEYVFSVHALDVVPELSTGFRLEDLEALLAEHSLATASITGTRSGPAL